jgi:PAS domain S-box-containing protein
MGIKNKVSLIICLLFCTFFISTSAIFIRISEDSLRRGIITQQVALVKTLVIGFDREMQERSRVLSNTATLIPRSSLSNPEKLRDLLRSQPALSRLFTTVLVCTPSGAPIASDSPTEVRLDTLHILGDDSNKHDFSAPKIYIASSSDQPLIVMTTPVLDKKKRPIAVICGAVRIFGRTMFSGFTATRIGKNGRIALITRDRIVIAHPDQHRLMRHFPTGADTGVDWALKHSHFAGETKVGNGSKMIVAIEAMRTTGWLAVTMLPLNEAYEPINSMRASAISLTVILLLITPIIVWLSMTLITRPLLTLRDRIMEMAANPQSDNLLGWDRRDEIGELASAFDSAFLARQDAEMQQQKLNRALRMLSDVNQALVRITDENGIVNEVCKIIVDKGGYLMSWVGYREYDENQTVRPVSALGLAEDYLANIQIEWRDSPHGRGPTGFAIRTGTTQVNQNSQNSPLLQPWHDAAQKVGYNSSIALPLLDGKNAFGVLTIYSTDFEAFMPAEVKLLEELAGDLAFGISAIRSQEERKKAEAALRKSEEKFRTVFTSMLEGMIIRDPDGRIVDMNSSAEQITGVSYGEFLKTAPFHFSNSAWREDGSPFLDDDHPALLAIRTGQPQQNIVCRIGHPDGFHRWMVSNSVPIFLEGETTPSEVVTSFIDITGRKNAEDELRKSEEQNRAIVNNLAEGIILRDTSGLIIEMNPSAVRIEGKSAEDYIKNNSFKLPINSIHEDGTPFTEDENPAFVALRTGKGCKNLVMRFDRPDGSFIWDSVNCVPLFREGESAPYAVVTSFIDITERKLMEEELICHKNHLEEVVTERTKELVLARDEADAANRAKSVFLANMSHELRTPLNAILGFSGILKSDSHLSENQTANIDIIKLSGEHLLALINDILEMAKIEAGRMRLDSAPIDLGALVRDVTKMMQIRAMTKGLSLQIDQASRFPRYIVGDESRLRQVLINLVGNAIKFTQDGGVIVRLGTRSNAISHLVIEVEDTGPGVPLEDRDRIFEPFVQLGEEAVNQGTGLGLAITRQFVQLMGGHISLGETAGGIGALFRVDLPLKEINAADLVKAIENDEGAVHHLEPGQPEYRILVVDDQFDNRLLLVKLMECVGFSVASAENGQQAVEMFSKWRPHFIWMDQQMPVMDGREAMEAIRSLPGGGTVKIVAVTASGLQEQRNEMLSAGMDDFIRKPYQFSEIYECLSKHLGVRYIYEDTSSVKHIVEDVTAENMEVLPENERVELRLALESLDEERIARAVAKVSNYDTELQNKLRRLIECFDYPAILKALRK